MGAEDILGLNTVSSIATKVPETADAISVSEELQKMDISKLTELRHDMSALALMIMRNLGRGDVKEERIEQYQTVIAYATKIEAVARERMRTLTPGEQASVLEESVSKLRNEYLTISQTINSKGFTTMTPVEWYEYDTAMRMYDNALDAVAIELHLLTTNYRSSPDFESIVDMHENIHTEDRELKNRDRELRLCGAMISKGYVLANMESADYEGLMNDMKVEMYPPLAVQKYVERIGSLIIGKRASERHAAAHIVSGAQSALRKWSRDEIVRVPGDLARDGIESRMAAVVDGMFDTAEKRWAGSNPVELAEIGHHLAQIARYAQGSADQGSDTASGLLATVGRTQALIQSALDDATKSRH